MLIKFLFVLTLVISAQAFAFDLKSDFKGFVSTGEKELYVDYLAPQKGKPTIILLNGLTYTTAQWDQMMVFLKEKGLGVVRYDMDGMGKTLLRYGVKAEPYAYMDQVTDLNALLGALSLKAPYNILGLSYGGGIGAAYAFKYPKKIKNLILMSPYTEALEAQDTWIKQQIALTRVQYPFNPASDEQLYDYYLKLICYTTYPQVEPIVLENPIKLEAVFRMTQGIRKLKLTDEVDRLPAQSTYLVIADKDQYIPREVLETFWKKIPKTARVEKILVKNSEHKIPEAQPADAANIVERIITAKVAQ